MSIAEIISGIKEMVENQYGWAIQAREWEEYREGDVDRLHSSLVKQEKIEFEFQVQDPVFGRSPDAAIQNFNQSYLDMLGYTLEEFQEKSYKQLTPENWH